MVKWWTIPIALVVGAGIAVGIVLFATGGAGHDLNKQLSDALSANKSLRTALDDAVSANHGLTDAIQKLHGQLDAQAKLLAGDDAAIAAGQRIINGIISDISGAGGDLGKQISAIADGFGRLYRLYHPDKNGLTKGNH